MKITCSILCHNYGRFLQASIESCLTQRATDCDLEILVIDDGSTDETEDVCRKYADRISVVRSNHNLGFGRSLDRAIEHATGDYVCLLDADDYFAPHKVASLLPEITKGRLFIQHFSQLIDESGEVLPCRLVDPGNTSTICVHRDAAMTLLPAQNEVFFHPIGRCADSVTLPIALTMYRVHERSMMRTSAADKWYANLSNIKHSLAIRLEDLAADPPFWARTRRLRLLAAEYRAKAYYDQLESALQSGNRLHAWAAIPPMFRWAAVSLSGLNSWYFRVAARGILNRPIHFDKTGY